MTNLLSRFAANRRGAIALMFAASLFPLVGLVALSIDYSFYAEARSQFTLAGDAATDYAIREATATYALDLAAGQSNATAKGNAQAAGDSAGSLWFTSQLATLPTTSVSGTTPTVNVTPNGASGSAGFTASVGYTGFYPPFFNYLFGRTSEWDITGASTATSQYQYVELLMMLDTSGSMLVSADSSDVLKMDENTVCIPTPDILDPNQHMNQIKYYYDPPGVNTPNGQFIPASAWDTGGVSDIANIQPNTYAYNNPPSTRPTVSCTAGKYTSGTYNGQAMYNGWPPLNGGANAPCAFACHNENSTWTSNDGSGYTYVDGVLTKDTSGVTYSYTQDLYGYARYLGVTLKTDVLFTAVENAITTMNTSEQVANQFTIGIYQFNDDVCPIVNGMSGDALPEATANLTGAGSALAMVEADDYRLNPSETAFPPTVNSSETDDFTNLPYSVYNLIHGTSAGGTGGLCLSGTSPTSTTSPELSALNVPPKPNPNVGQTAADPVKDFFLVTDGMEDSNQNSACGRVLGEMTSASAESTNSTTACDLAVCQPLKNLGFTVYVLDIPYPNVQLEYYDENGVALYGSGAGPLSDQHVADDYGSVNSSIEATNTIKTGTALTWNTGLNTSGVTEATTPPNEYALEQACATSPADFFLATNSDAVLSAMKLMLQSALSSSVRITN